MDTREKIAAPEAARERAHQARQAGARVVLVVGHFDPLLAEHALRLAEARQTGGWLVAAVADAPAPILPARARAELVAALRAVDCVVLGDGTGIAADTVIDERAEDLRRAEELRAHVRARAGLRA